MRRPLLVLACLLVMAAPVRADVLIEIQGAVRQPGIYTVADRATMAEVVRTAGGLTPTADRRRFEPGRRLDPAPAGRKLIVTVPFIGDSDRPTVHASRPADTAPPGRRTPAAVPSADGGCLLDLPVQLLSEQPGGGLSVLHPEDRRAGGGMIFGWDLRRFPLTLWIEPLVATPETQATYANALLEAVGKWNGLWSDLGFARAAFQLVTAEDQADVRLFWRTGLGASTLGTALPALGRTYPFRLEADPSQRQYGWKPVLRAEVNIDVSRAYSPTAMYLVIAHELGHVFGLGHTRNPRDLLYPTIGVPVPPEQQAEADRRLAGLVLDETVQLLRVHYAVVDGLGRCQDARRFP